jgi:hypothetical protein
MGQGARLELRMDPEDKALIERAAALTGRSLTAFVTEVVVARAEAVVHGTREAAERRPRPVGGWSFDLPDGWDAPLDDLAAYR